MVTDGGGYPHRNYSKEEGDNMDNEQTVDKVCIKCKEPKPLTDFHINRTRKDGLQSSCKVCQLEYNRTYYHRYTKKVLKGMMGRKRKYALKNYVKIVTEYLCNPCVDCGNVYHPASMVFDHRESKKKNRVFGMEGVMSFVRNGYSWNTIKKEIDKCEIRCHNCHFRKTSNDIAAWREISSYIEDFYSVNKKLHKYYNNGSKAFKKQKDVLSKKFAEYMLEQIKIVESEMKLIDVEDNINA